MTTLKVPRWTGDQDQVVKDLYPTDAPTARILARLRTLGRRCSVEALYARARVLKVSGVRRGQHPWAWPRRVVERVKTLHGQGLTDTAIAARMAATFASGRRGVTSLRTRLGLPINAAAILAGKRRAVETQKAVLGINHGGDLRALGYRRFAVRHGWPDDLPPRAVQILNVLADRGPKTGRELAVAIGMDGTGRTVAQLLSCSAHSKLCRGHGTYTGILLDRGLIAKQKRWAKGRPHGHARLPDLYMLTPHAVDVREECLER